MKVGIIIQARIGSQRLPGKVLKNIDGKTILEILIKRIQACDLPIIVATTVNKKDDILVEKLNALNIQFFRGNEEDVLSRFYECALENKFETIIRLTADNPFVDAKLIKKVTSGFISENNENLYMSTGMYPIGIAVEIFSFRSLADAFFNATNPKEREHVTPFIINKKDIVKRQINYKSDKEHYRLSIDTIEDFKLVEELIGHYNAENLTIDELIKVLDEHPELVQINSNVHQKKWNE